MHVLITVVIMAYFGDRIIIISL